MTTRVRARRDVVDRLATDDPVGEQRPSGAALLYLGAGQSLVLAVVPLDEVGIDDRASRVAGELAGLARALQRAHEYRGESEMRELSDASASACSRPSAVSGRSLRPV